jgi:hypothetical protein
VLEDAVREIAQARGDPAAAAHAGELDVAAQFVRGMIQAGQKNDQQAYETLLTAMRTYRDRSATGDGAQGRRMQLLGNVCARLNRPVEAAYWLIEATNADPTNVEAVADLGRLYADEPRTAAAFPAELVRHMGATAPPTAAPSTRPATQPSPRFAEAWRRYAALLPATRPSAEASARIARPERAIPPAGPPPADGKERVIVLLYGKNAEGNAIYAYVRMTFDQIDEFRRAILVGKAGDPAKFGDIVASGRGEPSPEVREEVKRQYPMLTGAPAGEPVVITLPPATRPAVAALPQTRPTAQPATTLPSAVPTTREAIDMNQVDLQKAEVMLIYCKNAEGKPVYNYVRMTLRQIEQLKAAVLVGRPFNPSDFGTIIASGQGEPTESVKKEIAEQYYVLSAETKPVAAPPATQPASP